MRKNWTDTELQYLKNHKDMSNAEIAAVLKRTERSVEAKRIRLKPRSKIRPYKHWTDKETDYLKHNYKRMSTSSIGKKLNRSKASIKHKMQDLGLCIIHTEDLSVSCLAEECFHVSVNVIRRWYEKFGMPAKTYHRNGCIYYYVNAEEFWKWAETHKKIIPWRQYERGTILPEPEFVKKEFQSLKLMQPNNNRKKWTKAELAAVQRDKYYYGLTNKELEQKYGRSHDSIKHVLRMDIHQKET